MSTPKPTVFLSYSHRDETWKDRVATALKALELQNELEVWDDRRIAAGDGWFAEIEQAMNRAAVAVLLVSTDFLASGFIRGTEVPHLLKRRQEEGLRIIPLFVRPSPWQAVDWLAAIQGRPKDAKPLSKCRKAEADEFLSELALEIRAWLNHDREPPVREAPAGGAGIKPGVSTPGSAPPTTPSPEGAATSARGGNPGRAKGLPASLRDLEMGGGPSPGVETPGFTPAPPRGALPRLDLGRLPIITAGNLSELTLTLGEVERAVAFGKQSFDLADRSDSASERTIKRTTLADALHQAGRWEESAEFFREAEALQAEWQSRYPRLYSLAGYRYCDLLLSREEPEDGAIADSLAADSEVVRRFREACREVQKRAEQTLEWAQEQSLVAPLEVALDHLSLGRAHLGLALTSPRPEVPGKEAVFAKAAEHLDLALENLRQSANEDDLPRGLLARATLRRLQVSRPLPRRTFLRHWRSPSEARCVCTSATLTWNGPGSTANWGTATASNGT